MTEESFTTLKEFAIFPSQQKKKEKKTLHSACFTKETRFFHFYADNL